MRISPGFGAGSGQSFQEKLSGPPNFSVTIAFMLLSSLVDSVEFGLDKV
jgi:hypothetical protein